MSQQNKPSRVRPMGGHSGHGPGMMGPKVKPKDSKKTLKRLWEYLNKQKGMLFFVFLLVFLSNVLMLIGPMLIGFAIDTMVGGKGHVDFEKLITIVISMIVVYVFASLMTWFQTYYMIGVAQETVWELRKDLFAKVQTLPLKFFDIRPHGELMSRLTNDVENINTTLTQSTTQLFSSAITLVGALGMMLYLSPLLTILSLICIPIGIFASTKIMKKTRIFFAQQQKELGEINGYIEETISGQKVVKAYCREEKILSEFLVRNDRLKGVGLNAQIFSGIIMPLMNAINNISFAVVACAGGWMAISGIITIGVIASFLNYTRQFTRPINEIANQFNMILSALAGAERVFEIMDEHSEFEDNISAPCIGEVAGKVELKNVDFSYVKDVPVLKNICLLAEQGQTIALVGPTGAGKTTIVNLLTRFYDIDNGQILIDNKDIRIVEKDSLRKSLGIVLQDTYLFSDTVMENIRYGRLDATDEEVKSAARLANAERFILRLHDGYNTVLSEDGGNLSQGQKQLLSIARTILANPSILILDEATSSVDTRTEKHIQEAMLVLMKGRTSFVIAHRLSTIKDADVIMVINGGEIIEKGTHKELLEAKGFYYDLHNSQFKKQAS